MSGHDALPAEQMTDRERLAYRAGFEDAMSAFAWWQDGVQYVGSGISTLKSFKGKEHEVFSYTPRVAADMGDKHG